MISLFFFFNGIYDDFHGGIYDDLLMIYWWFIDLDHRKFFGIPIYRFTIKMLSFYGILMQLHGDLWGLLMILWDIYDSNN